VRNSLLAKGFCAVDTRGSSLIPTTRPGSKFWTRPVVNFGTAMQFYSVRGGIFQNLLLDSLRDFRFFFQKNRVQNLLPGVGERSHCCEALPQGQGGAMGSENVGMSNRNAGEIPAHRKSKVSLTMVISQG